MLAVTGSEGEAYNSFGGKWGVSKEETANMTVLAAGKKNSLVMNYRLVFFFWGGGIVSEFGPGIR